MKTEAEQIAEATLKPIAEFAEKIENRAPYVYEMKKTVENEKCVFLENNRCAIYPLRPIICRFYPYELKTANSGKYKFLFTEECPGINKGRILSKAYFKKMLRLAHARYRQNSDSDRSQIQ